MVPSLPTRIASKIAVDSDSGCWRWGGYVGSQGYGQVAIDGRTTYIHRAVYALLVGPIPEGLTLDHVEELGCLHRDCCNPDHLQPVTIEENARRGQYRRRRREREERSRWIEGVRGARGTQAEIGRRFGVSQQQVSAIKLGKCWS